ncbi:magnesium and cobalt transport protein CorA [Limnospira fusiformis CCALA 023]|uniref:magnesium/cobalt transporter CorA n=1 Tax=Arthrospira sp. PCC 8006 TaxID=1982224 RepID=UPI00396EAD4D
MAIVYFMTSNIKPPSSPDPELEITEDEEEESELDYFFDQPGTLPGTLDLKTDAVSPQMVVIEYSQTTAMRTIINSPSEYTRYHNSECISWLDIQGLGNLETWRQMTEIFNLHPIALEDVVNVPQRPKVVYYDNPDHVVIIAWMVMLSPRSQKLHKEQVSIILGEHYVITVQEKPKYDCLEPVRNRIRQNQGNITKYGTDYLAYAILDAIIDEFFPVLEVYSDMLEDLEDEVLFQPQSKTMQNIYKTKRDLIVLRRAIWYQRESLNILIRDKNRLVSKKVRVYLRDCYDNTVNIRDMLETYRELASDLISIYLSSMGNRMNEIMKVLTVISTIFIPLTFIVGVYGMNFDPETSPWNMPELKWYYGYPISLALMAIMAGSLIYFFWKRGWFNDFSQFDRDN